MVLAVIGANIFDSMYYQVESIMKDKHVVLQGDTISPHRSLNSTITYDKLYEHNVLLIYSKPVSDLIKLQVTDPKNDTFEKESDNGYVYHIMDRNPQDQGDYIISILNTGNQPANVEMIVGEDPYLSGQCNPNYGFTCYEIPLAIAFVIGGVVAVIVGGALTFIDLRNIKMTKK